MTIWQDFGFRENPYGTGPLPANEEGNSLLVGRDDEVERLLRRLRSLDTHPTIEGDNGVGKTSLVAVAAYRGMQESKDGGGRLLLPMGRAYQLTKETMVADLERQVLFDSAQLMIQSRSDFDAAGISAPSLGEVEHWLTNPTYRNADVGAFGFNIGGGTEPNTGSGFDENGFRTIVLGELQRCFPTRDVGGIVCTLDNLELLDTSLTARSVLETARDTLLAIPGLRWVLCGAKGIVRSAASSPRLDGVLGDPIEVSPIADSLISEFVARRVAVFALGDHAYVPLDAQGFEHLYRVLHSNLRNSLKYSQEYAEWLFENALRPIDPEDRIEQLTAWIAYRADAAENDTRGVRERAWQVFDALVETGGSCSPGDFEAFGFNSPQAMREPVRQLERANLVDSSIDETDQRRRTTFVTPRGWLVHHKRSGYPSL